jgi:hypothetical protein
VAVDLVDQQGLDTDVDADPSASSETYNGKSL